MVADGHAMVREGIAASLREEFDADIDSDVSDGYTLLKRCRHKSPDVVIMDLHLTRPSGAETMKKLLDMMPTIKIIVVSAEAETSDAVFALSHGALAFIPKQARADDFANAVRAAIGGYAYLPTALLGGFVKSRSNLPPAENDFGLSHREIEILKATLDGMSIKDVAAKLDISPRTVETHRNRIYRKTSCRNPDELAQILDND